MNNKTLFAILSVAIMLLSTIPFAMGAQPPVDLSTFYVGTIGQPRRVSGWRAYDTASGELIFNVYETLIFFDRDLTKPPEQQGQAGVFKPMLATALPTKTRVLVDLRNVTAVDRTDPVSTQWMEYVMTGPPLVLTNTVPVDPSAPLGTIWLDTLSGFTYTLTSWADISPVNPGKLGFSDQVDLIGLVPPEPKTWWHVDELLGPPGPGGPGAFTLFLMMKSPTGQEFHLKHWRDNNPDLTLAPSDVVILEKKPIPGEIHGFHVIYLDDEGSDIFMIVERFVYEFPIRVGVPFQPWKRRDGFTVTTSTLDTADVEYSIEAGMVHDGSGSPQWMWYLPLFDVMGSSAWTDGTYGTGTDADFVQLGRMIDDAITRTGTTVSISLSFDFPQIAFYQILSQTWGSIVDKEMAIDYNAWNGTWTTGIVPVWKAWRRYPTSGYTPLDQNKPDPYGRAMNPMVPEGGVVMCGTGPYQLNFWNKATLTWQIDKFPAYWGGWTNFDYAHPYHVDHVIVAGVADWTTRKLGFLAGVYDTIVVPRSNMMELIGVPGLVTIPNLPTAAQDDIFFTSPVATGSPYMPTVGPPPNNNMSTVFSWDDNGAHMRKAFAYALNRTTLKDQIWLSEAMANRSTWHIKGLVPDYYDYSLAPYDINLAKIRAELVAAQFTMGATTKSAWQWGFSIPMLYNLGNDARRDTNNLIKVTIEALSGTVDPVSGQTAGTFSVPNIGLEWSIYLGEMEAFTMPAWQIGWLADFLDVDNWVRPYMNTYGDFSYYQGYSNLTVDAQMNIGVKTEDGPARRAIYYDLQKTYYEDVVSIPTVQAFGRAWMRIWVQGWYYNIIYPGVYFYDRWKGFTADVNGDGVVDIFDLVALAVVFGEVVPPGDARDISPPAPRSPPAPPYPPGDGIIDIFDIVEAALQFGYGVP